MRFMNSNYQDPRNFSQAPQPQQQGQPSLQQAIQMLRGGDTFGATNILQSLVGLPQRDYSFQQNAMAQPAQNLGMPQSLQYAPPSYSPGPQQPSYQQTKPQGLLGTTPALPPNPYVAPQKPVKPVNQAVKQYSAPQKQYGQYSSTL